MINSRILAQAVTVIVITASTMTLSACAVPGTTGQAQHDAKLINYCVKRGTHMECRKVSAAAYVNEIEREHERLEMRENEFED